MFKLYIMASVKFSVRGKRNPSKIYIRLVVDKTTDFKLITPLLINPTYFNNKIQSKNELVEILPISE